jgi:CRP-like cAMP-binding protein
MESEQHAEGHVLFKAGDPPDELYLIQSGRVVFAELDKHLQPGRCSARSPSSHHRRCAR